jgi:molecular chaperone HtpG
MSDKNNKRTLNFKTEVSQLLNLMIHSMYSNRDVFLRELISNASDALDKVRFCAISDEKILEKDSDYRIIVSVDKEKKTIIVEDNGIGMNEEEVIANIGTIANSGTKKFLEQLDKGEVKDSNMIGQFGVGFYSCFMVAAQVSLETRKAAEEANSGILWSSSGDGKFNLQAVNRATRGTKITLHIREDAAEYLDDWKIKEIIGQYSEHISFPVLMPEKIQQEEGEEGQDKKKKTEEKTELKSVNSAEALWLKSPRSVKNAEYESFYKSLSYDFEPPLAWMHNRVEGTLEYSSILFIPKKAPFDLFDREQKHGLKLYVKRVFIMDESESLLPNWLRFVRGVVDCSDIPLNVSREILQDNKVVRKIRAALVKRIITKLEELAKNKPDDFTILWTEFGKVIKEGIIEDHENKEKIASLLRFASTENAKEEVSLSQYCERMQENQESIFYLCAENLEAAKSSPHLELFKEKGIEVLLLTDRIDEWVSSHLTEFNGKKLCAANRGEGQEELGKIASKDTTDVAEEVVDCKKLLEKLKSSLGERVSDVRESKRLRSSPACVVTDDAQMTHNMQKIMQAMGQKTPETKPILEINPSHQLVQQLNDGKLDNFDDWAALLFEQALLAEGAQLGNPGDFVTRMNRLLVSKLDS